MVRDLLRTIGAACIIAGTFLYFIDSSDNNDKENMDKGELHEEISALQETLNRTEDELASLQLATSAAQDTVNKNETDDTEKTNDSKSSATSTMKTLLHIEAGTASSSISYELERSGIIEDAADFEDYLATNKLSEKIQIGEYDLDSSMSISKIAKIITNSN